MGRLAFPKSSNVFERSLTQAAVAAGAPAYELVALNANARDVGILSIELVLKTAVSSEFALAYSASDGSTRTAPVNGINISGGEIAPATSPSVSLAEFANAWSVVPVFTASDVIRQQLVSVVGETILWTWPENDPLIVPYNNDANGQSLVIFNPGAGVTGTTICNIRWMELPAYNL